ncbi:MAG TPA: hypothetical protein O0X97_02775, partial [Methanocorpusculum sp.]|nr:hypothetical protein [Methanocorpusculum sp.]
AALFTASVPAYRGTPRAAFLVEFICIGKIQLMLFFNLPQRAARARDMREPLGSKLKQAEGMRIAFEIREDSRFFQKHALTRTTVFSSDNG